MQQLGPTTSSGQRDGKNRRSGGNLHREQLEVVGGDGLG